MFAVCVKPAARKRICTRGLIWVKDSSHELYVSKKDRGTWATRKQAEEVITESWEIVVEEPNADVTGGDTPKL